MTTIGTAMTGAASGFEETWHGIDWAKAHRQVRRLQMRIAKAVRDKRWNKVKALQWLLTHSFSGKALAVKRVTENRGKRTPGVDGETWDTLAKKAKAVMSLKGRGYQPRPLRRVRKYGGKLLIKPAKKNVQAHSQKVRATIKNMRTAKQEEVIAKLNPIIRGWANYHQNQVAKKTFQKVDSLTWKQLWRWACRRHPSKSKTWIKNRYFLHVGTRSWVFGTKVKGDGSKVRFVKLVQASDTPIRRHIKIKGEANPFDPDWELYFEERLDLIMKDDLKGRRRLLSLWRTQKGRCPNCCEPITKTTGWHVHHLLPKAQGGMDNLANLVLLHPNCHRQAHHLERREQPAPVKRGFTEA